MAKIPLTAEPVEIASPLFAAISNWKFADEFMARIPADDLPQRVKCQHGSIGNYLDPDKNIVAFDMDIYPTLP